MSKYTVNNFRTNYKHETSQQDNSVITDRNTHLKSKLYSGEHAVGDSPCFLTRKLTSCLCVVCEWIPALIKCLAQAFHQLALKWSKGWQRQLSETTCHCNYHHRTRSYIQCDLFLWWVHVNLCLRSCIVSVLYVDTCVWVSAFLYLSCFARLTF